MTKALDKSIEIQDVYLIEKTGGKSGDFRRHRMRAAVLTVSDSVCAGTREDRFRPCSSSAAGRSGMASDAGGSTRREAIGSLPS